MLKQDAMASSQMGSQVSRRAIPIEAPRFQRVDISVLGRYMLSNKTEFPCQVIAMSPGDAVVIAPITGELDERVVIYLDHLGRIEGPISSTIDGGFEMNLIASARKRDKLAAQLTWLANKDELGLAEDRRHDRVVPDIRHSKLVLDDGRQYNCKIVDISLSGAAIDMDVRPTVGTSVTLGRMRGRIVRHFDYGIGVEFISAQQILSVVQQNLDVN